MRGAEARRLPDELAKSAHQHLKATRRVQRLIAHVLEARPAPNVAARVTPRMQLRVFHDQQGSFETYYSLSFFQPNSDWSKHEFDPGVATANVCDEIPSFSQNHVSLLLKK